MASVLKTSKGSKEHREGGLRARATAFVRGLLLVCGVVLGLWGSGPRAEAARVKDLTLIDGGRDNQLVGYGLVVGLANKGDSRSDQVVRTVMNSLMRFGINLTGANLVSNNVAAVMVTADIPGFARNGTRIDVTVASMVDAKTIQGGVLLQTPLVGADDIVYAVAQGAIAVGGFIGGEAGPGGATVQKNHPTVGMIPGGALVEKEIPAHFVRDKNIELMLLNPDYTSAARIAQVINQEFPQSAMAKNPGTVNVCVPDDFEGYEVNFIARMGALELEPDVPARVVINERTGTIVATANVRVSTVAISHGSLLINVTSNLGVSQPGPLARGGNTVVTQSTQTSVEEGFGSLRILDDAPTIQQVAGALNALGLSTRDMMSIFQTMKRAGALQAELILN
jgi:flagellar P-ring protein precursor FlgI